MINQKKVSSHNLKPWSENNSETICPINRQSGIDELLLSLSTPIKSIINRDQWKMSSILLRICNMSFGGLNATTPRFVIEGSNDFKNLPQRQKVQEPFRFEGKVLSWKNHKVM